MQSFADAFAEPAPRRGQRVPLPESQELASQEEDQLQEGQSLMQQPQIRLGDDAELEATRYEWVDRDRFGMMPKGKPIGSGTYGRVYKARHSPSGRICAVKITSYDNATLPSLQREVENLFQVDHPNLVKIIDVMVLNSCAEIWIVTEFLPGGDLFHRVAKCDFELTERDAAAILKQILLGLESLHSREIAHRDLKPENILCTGHQFLSTDRVVIADFGCSKQISSESFLSTTYNQDTGHLAIGSAAYLAPEIASASPRYTKACDIWSVGVIAWVLLLGFLPFGDPTQDGYDFVLEQIKGGELDFSLEEWEGISPTAQDFVRSLLTRLSRDRPSATQCLNHPWLRDIPQRPSSSKNIDIRGRAKSFVTLRQNPSASGANSRELARGASTVMEEPVLDTQPQLKRARTDHGANEEGARWTRVSEYLRQNPDVLELLDSAFAELSPQDFIRRLVLGAVEQ